MNLYEQFRKVSNAYFLLGMIIALIPGASPITPVTAILPLLFVLLVAAVKDGYEDYKRHVADNNANSAKVTVLRNQRRLVIPSKSVVVGDVVIVHVDEEIRADLLLLGSARPEGQAYIDTAQLDGETSVKSRKAKILTAAKFNSDESFGPTLTVCCEKPNSNLAAWKAYVEIRSSHADTVEKAPLSIEQFLYRGSVIRNTEWVYGVVVYAGVDTKMFRNLKQKPPKFSSLDKRLNVLILGAFFVKHIFIFTLCGLSVWWEDESTFRHGWYLQFGPEVHGVLLFGWRYLTYFILLSYMIPISLFVTMELCKAVQGTLMAWDEGMSRTMPDGTVIRCRPKTTNLNEQLSQVEYVFTDKTGTLTENIMEYVAGSIAGAVVHDERRNPGGLRHLLMEESVLRYLTALAVCNAVVPFRKGDGETVYESQSPDESALVKAALWNGVRLCDRTSKAITIHLDRQGGEDVTYEIMAELDFTPERKMMSVIVMDKSGQYIVFTKGADSSMMPRMAKEEGHAEQDALSKSVTELEATSRLGLRTLVIGWKTITKEMFDKWNDEYQRSLCDMQDRKAKVLESCLKMEHSFHLVGTTAIEDKLQEGVPETIRFMLDAGIDIWMLTGDKRETAVNIAASCGLVNPQTDTVEHIDVPITDEIPIKESISKCRNQLEELRDVLGTTDRVCMVIDGESLQLSMDHHLPLFMYIARRVTCAVCCRLTPLQKSEVVRHFQDGHTTALAVGDG
eukprot:PhF_6_TR29350/c0_g1_i5/m.43140/K14802/DRS2, ATP8A; phospholipid-transporting ATPase